MTLDLKLAGRAHDWVMAEGRECHSPEDVDNAVDRFVNNWPRITSDVLRYVSSMLTAQLHVRTIKPAEIIKGVHERITDNPPLHRHWWQIG